MRGTQGVGSPHSWLDRPVAVPEGGIRGLGKAVGTERPPTALLSRRPLSATSRGHRLWIRSSGLMAQEAEGAGRQALITISGINKSSQSERQQSCKIGAALA